MKNDRPSLPVPGFQCKMHFTKRLSWIFLIHSNKCWWLPRCHTWTMICHGWFESISAKPGPPPQCNRGAREYDYEEVTQEIHDVGRTLAISSPTCGNGKMIGRRTACQAARKNWQKSWSKTFLAVNKKNTCANDIIFSPTMFTFFKLFFWLISFCFAWFVNLKPPHFAVHVVRAGRRVVNIFDCGGGRCVWKMNVLSPSAANDNIVQTTRTSIGHEDRMRHKNGWFFFCCANWKRRYMLKCRYGFERNVCFYRTFCLYACDKR